MCDLDRRSFLRIGLGASAAAFLPGEGARGDERRATAKSVIVLYMEGGPSQLDTFDLKPGRGTGGPFKEIETDARGIRICEHLPRLAREMRNVSLVRSMTSKEGDHQRGQYLLHTGQRPEGAVTHPGIGSYVSREIGAPDASLPNCIAVRARLPGSAFLKAEHSPYGVDEPGQPIRDIRPARGVDAARSKERQEILGMLEEGFPAGGPWVDGRREAYRKAERLMNTPQLKAFELDGEAAALRDAYGRNPFGQGCLLARRLVERGVKFVEVGLYGWDTHADNFAKTKELMETLDPGFATLVRDLRDRSLLADTLVVWMGEFGRTPRINPQNGRDHWPKAFSVAFAGGGVQGGRVVGATDADGFDIVDRPVTVEDYAATIYRPLGIDVKKPTLNESGRPIRILSAGVPVKELF